MTKYKFANRMERMVSTEIRDLLKWIADPTLLSFAGGLPAAELFPVSEIANVAHEVVEREGRTILQYGSVVGSLPLREKIAKRMGDKFGTKAVANDIMVVSGSQQGLDLVGKVFLNPGDIVLVESPTYMGMLNAFDQYEVSYVEVPTDDQGVIPEELEKILRMVPRVKLMYVVPDFQNPTGICWTMERRRKFMEIINKYELPVVEDNPYYELRYEGETLPALKSLDTKGLVMFMGSFSKIFCPGLRLGWVCADQEIIDKLISVKQASVLLTSNLDISVADEYIATYDLDGHVEDIKKLYRHRRDLIIKCMKEKFPKDVKWTHPEGGLFLWLTFPENISAFEVFRSCLNKKVCAVPGDCFYPYHKTDRSLRVNYSCLPDEKIIEGIDRMAQAIKEVMAENK